MKRVTIQIFQFSELSDDIKNNIISEYKSWTPFKEYIDIKLEELFNDWNKNYGLNVNKNGKHYYYIQNYYSEKCTYIYGLYVNDYTLFRKYLIDNKKITDEYNILENTKIEFRLVDCKNGDDNHLHKLVVKDDNLQYSQILGINSFLNQLGQDLDKYLKNIKYDYNFVSKTFNNLDVYFFKNGQIFDRYKYQMKKIKK